MVITIIQELKILKIAQVTLITKIIIINYLKLETFNKLEILFKISNSLI